MERGEGREEEPRGGEEVLLDSPTCRPLWHQSIYMCVGERVRGCMCGFWLPLCPGQIGKKSFLRIA